MIEPQGYDMLKADNGILPEYKPMADFVQFIIYYMAAGC